MALLSVPFCSRCQRSSRPGARFCSRCGAAVAPMIPRAEPRRPLPPLPAPRPRCGGVLFPMLLGMGLLWLGMMLMPRRPNVIDRLLPACGDGPRAKFVPAILEPDPRGQRQSRMGSGQRDPCYDEEPRLPKRGQRSGPEKSQHSPFCD